MWESSNVSHGAKAFVAIEYLFPWDKCGTTIDMYTLYIYKRSLEFDSSVPCRHHHTPPCWRRHTLVTLPARFYAQPYCLHQQSLLLHWQRSKEVSLVVSYSCIGVVRFCSIPNWRVIVAHSSSLPNWSVVVETTSTSQC